ncbi:MAG: hypothetical protein LBU92_05590, partial [Prevotellaceae bacterium]|nr:hypothetical protein [Prevotellaceae bacterium]
MKILLKTCCLVAAAALLGLTSCLDNGKEVFYRDFFGVVQRNDNGSWYFMADDSTTFWPANGP